MQALAGGVVASSLYGGAHLLRLLQRLPALLPTGGLAPAALASIEAGLAHFLRFLLRHQARPPQPESIATTWLRPGGALSSTTEASSVSPAALIEALVLALALALFRHQARSADLASCRAAPSVGCAKDSGLVTVQGDFFQASLPELPAAGEAGMPDSAMADAGDEGEEEEEEDEVDIAAYDF